MLNSKELEAIKVIRKIIVHKGYFPRNEGTKQNFFAKFLNGTENKKRSNGGLKWIKHFQKNKLRPKKNG